MANPTMKIGEIVDLMMANTGQNMTEDIMYQWFEELYRMIRETKWSWNWLWEGRTTMAPTTTDAAAKWSGTQGNNYITLDGGGNLQSLADTIIHYNHTGRVFYQDERTYRIINVGGLNNNRIYLDRPLHATFAAQQIEFCRQNYAFRTSSVKSVEVDFLKKASSQNDDYLRDFLVTRYWTSSGVPITWKVDDNFSLPRPVQAPVVHSTTGAAFTAGKYYYFFTYVDQESGMISAPGPILEYTATTASPTFNYGSTNLGEYTYPLRLWRSTVNPSRTRAPMFAVNGPAAADRTGTVGLESSRDAMWVKGAAGDKDPWDNTDRVQDLLSDAALTRREQYYEGAWTTVDMLPCPDDTYSFEVYRLHNWSTRPHKDMYVDLGRNNQVLELLRFGVHQFTELQNRDGQNFRQAVIQFRQQLAYLLRQDRSAAQEDPGVNRHRDYRQASKEDFYDPTKYWHWSS